MAKKKKMTEKQLRDDVNSLKEDPHEGDRGEAKRKGKKPKKQLEEGLGAAIGLGLAGGAAAAVGKKVVDKVVDGPDNVTSAKKLQKATGTKKNVSPSSGSGKKSNAGGGGALAMAKAGKLYPVLDSVQSEDHTGHGHDCEKVHPDKSHKEWKEGEDEHDKNAASEGPHKESNNVQQFIGNVSQKNYAAANKYLRAALEDKLKQRISDTRDNLGF